MDLWTIIKVLVRRWYVSLPVLLAAAYATHSVTSEVPSSYRATGSVILFVPNGVRSGSDLPRNNPYLTFSGSLNITSHALVRVVGSLEQREAFQRRGLRSDYGIQPEDTFPGIRFAVAGKDSVVVVKTAQTLIETIEQRLSALEEESGAPPEERIGVRVLDPPRRAVEVPPAVARLAAVIVGLGMALATALALALEAVSRSRRKKRQARASRAAVLSEGTVLPAADEAAPVGHEEPLSGERSLEKAGRRSKRKDRPVPVPSGEADAPQKRRRRLRKTKAPVAAFEPAHENGHSDRSGDSGSNGHVAARSDERVSAARGDG